jgi:hypothetical protein
VPYLELWGIVACGWQLGRAALIAASKLASGSDDSAFMRNKIATARFYAASVMPRAGGIARGLAGGGESALELSAEQF